MQTEAKEQMEVLIMPPSTPLRDLAAIKSRIEELDREIKETELACGITRLKEQRALKQQEYDTLLAEIVPTLTFTEDRFLKALKKKGDSYREGALKLIRHPTVRRKILLDKFLDAFPSDIIRKCCKIELTKADNLVGKDTMEDFVEKETTYSYELVSLGGPDGDQ